MLRSICVCACFVVACLGLGGCDDENGGGDDAGTDTTDDGGTDTNDDPVEDTIADTTDDDDDDTGDPASDVAVEDGPVIYITLDESMEVLLRPDDTQPPSWDNMSGVNDDARLDGLTVTTDGLTPEITTTSFFDGAEATYMYTIDVPSHGTWFAITGETISGLYTASTVVVEDIALYEGDLHHYKFKLAYVTEDLVESLASTFGVTLTSGTGILIQEIGTANATISITDDGASVTGIDIVYVDEAFDFSGSDTGTSGGVVIVFNLPAAPFDDAFLMEVLDDSGTPVSGAYQWLAPQPGTVIHNDH